MKFRHALAGMYRSGTNERRADVETVPAPIIHFYYPHGVGADVVSESVSLFSHNRPGKYVWTVKTFGHLSADRFSLPPD